MKATNSYITEGQKIKIPPLCKSLYYEAELGIVFGRTGKDIPENHAMDFVGGYILALDMTAWDIQQDAKKKGQPWTLSKSWDTACPVSELIPKDKIPNPFSLPLWLKVNGKTKQDGNTDDMIFKIPYLISFLSKYFILEEGDVLLTGTPFGAGEAKPGDMKFGAATETSVEADIGLTFGGKSIKFRDFHILRLLGRGSFAKVVLVEERSTEQVFALKIIKKQWEDLSKHKIEELVETERRVFEIATDCPFLVGLHGCFQSPSRLFYVIDFASGGDMISHTGRYGRLPEDHVRFYSAEISIALNFLHERGVAYRGLKLDNILLDRDGHIKLTDYGVSKAGLQPGLLMTTLCGTLRYMSPELLRREKYGYSVDWWALRVVMYEMLVGSSPFEADFDSPIYEECVSEGNYSVRTVGNSSLYVRRCCLRIEGLLNKNPDQRLGFVGVQSHIFYCTTHWDMLRGKQVAPPFKPEVNSEGDVQNFDADFTNEPAGLTPDNWNIADAGKDDFNFQCFEYDWDTSENQENSTSSEQKRCVQNAETRRHYSEVHYTSSRFSSVVMQRSRSVPANFLK